MIGITSEFTKIIENCERHPEIKYIQILFCQRNIGIYYPEKRELDLISNYLKNRKIIPIIHISMGKDPKWWNNTPIHLRMAPKLLFLISASSRNPKCQNSFS